MVVPLRSKCKTLHFRSLRMGIDRRSSSASWDESRFAFALTTSLIRNISPGTKTWQIIERSSKDKRPASGSRLGPKPSGRCKIPSRDADLSFLMSSRAAEPCLRWATAAHPSTGVGIS